MSFKTIDRRGEKNRPTIEHTVPDSVFVTAPKPKKTLNELIAECPLRPTPGRYVFLGDAFEYKGRMAIPDTAKRRGTTGIILKANPIEGEPALFQVGQRVLIGRYSGTLLEFENRPSWHIIQDAEILAWIDGDDQLVDQTVG